MGKPRQESLDLWFLEKKDLSLYKNRTKIERSQEVMLLEVTFGEEFNFKKHREYLLGSKIWITLFSADRKVLSYWKGKSIRKCFYQ